MVVVFDPIDWVVRPEALSNVRDAFAVYVIGSSMEPRYEQGDMILIHPSRPVQRDNDVLFLSEVEGGFAALVKRLVDWDTANWIVRQYNPSKQYELPRSQWGRAHAVIGRFSRR
jgi:phage repressor protein C with HTH and peptisase S24 domain